MFRYLNKSDRKTIYSIINTIKADFKELDLTLGLSSNKEDNFRSLLEMTGGDFNKNINSLLAYFQREWKLSQKNISEVLPLEIYISDVIICIHFLIFELLLCYFFPDSIKKLRPEIQKSVKSRFLYFSLCYNNILSSLIESRRNHLEGKQIIGDVLFRHFSEMIESSILVLVDEEYFKLIRDVPKNEEEEKKRWNLTKPSEVRKRLDHYFTKYIDNDEFAKSIKEVSKLLYNKYSKSVHGDFYTQFSSNFKQKNPVGEETFDFLGVNYNTMKDYFINFMIYNYNIIFVVFTAFISFNHLPMKKFGRVGKEIGYTFKIFEQLMKGYLGKAFSIDTVT